jgi:hypothetical protein
MKQPLLATLLVILVTASSASALAAPQRITATYSLSRNNQEMAQVVETFTQSRGKYQIESVTTAVGVYRVLTRDAIKLVSKGVVTKAGLQPSHFEHHRGARKDKLIMADFDWQKRQATFVHDGNTETAPIPTGMQDRISLMYQFMFMSPKSALLTVDMSNGKKVTQYEYLRSGEEALSTKAGAFQTVRFTRKRTPGDDGTEVWLAKDKFLIPVKVVIEEEKGGRMEQVLTKLRIQ